MTMKIGIEMEIGVKIGMVIVARMVCAGSRDWSSS